MYVFWGGLCSRIIILKLSFLLLKGEKILVRKTTTRDALRDLDLDLEAARLFEGTTRRSSNFTLDSTITMDEVKHAGASVNVGVKRDMTTSWMRPSSDAIASSGFGTYETRSQLVGPDGQKLAVQTPIPGSSAAGSADVPTNSNDIFPGR